MNTTAKLFNNMEKKMTASERIDNFLKNKEIDRLPIMEWAPIWDVTLKRWQSEGLNFCYKNYPKDWRALQLYLGLDANVQFRFNARTPNITPIAKSHGAGILKNAEEYEIIKKTMFSDPSIFLKKENLIWLNETRQEGNTIHWFTVEGFFWFARELFGIEKHLYSFYDEPDLLHRMCYDYVEWLKQIFEFIGNNFKFDYMSFAEDMSYNNGPMLSKELFDEFLSPYYKKVIPILKKLEIPVFIDSDGDITKAVDWYAEVGADGMFPLERQAGVDVSLYLKKQPKMFFLGHFDKMCMKFGENAMRKEFERLLPSLNTKRFIPSVDHQTPPDVSLENYKIYVKLLKEYVGLVRND